VPDNDIGSTVQVYPDDSEQVPGMVAVSRVVAYQPDVSGRTAGSFMDAAQQTFGTELPSDTPLPRGNQHRLTFAGGAYTLAPVTP
jgi:hypothetical protein